MRRFLRCWLAPLVLVLFGVLPQATADEVHPGLGDKGPAPQNVQSGPAVPTDAGDKVEKPPPTFAYLVAVLATIVVLCILCVPSRKAESSTARR